MGKSSPNSLCSVLFFSFLSVMNSVQSILTNVKLPQINELS